jgi:hypothetical protein
MYTNPPFMRFHLLTLMVWHCAVVVKPQAQHLGHFGSQVSVYVTPTGFPLLSPLPIPSLWRHKLCVCSHSAGWTGLVHFNNKFCLGTWDKILFRWQSRDPGGSWLQSGNMWFMIIYCVCCRDFLHIHYFKVASYSCSLLVFVYHIFYFDYTFVIVNC